MILTEVLNTYPTLLLGVLLTKYIIDKTTSVQYKAEEMKTINKEPFTLF